MKLRHLIYILFIAVMFGFSCTPYKNVPYFQDLKRDSIVTENIDNYKPLVIAPGDLLALHVTSLNREADAIFNYNLDHAIAVDATGVAGAVAPGETSVYGYLVDQNGDIRLPVVGLVHVAGMSTEQIATTIEDRLSTTLTNPVVDIRLQNFKISVLGDVKLPGTYGVQSERITVTEALALAGDMNTTGIRTILLVREIDGKRKYITLDLKSKQTFTSPYFYLRNNDLLYVQPDKERVSDNGTTYQKAGIILSVLSIIVYLLKK